MDERTRLRILASIVLVPQIALTVWLYGRRVASFADVIPICDFAVFYTGGTLANQGRLAAAYDAATYQATMREVSGDLGRMFWLYPPPMAVVSQLFAAIPYRAGLALWLTLGIAGWMWAASRVDGRRGMAWMLAFPGTVIAILYAQASLWLAPLLAEGLRLLESRPILAGCLFGLLALKPHWLLVVGVGLVAGRHLRASIAAGVVGAALGALSLGLHGPAPWAAFFATLDTAIVEVSKMDTQDVVSPFSAAPAVLAGPVQTVCSLLGFGATGWVFVRRYSHDTRVAVLPIAMTLVSPYLHFYDLLVLGIPGMIVARRLEARGQDLLPYVAVVGAALWACRVSGALFDVQPYPLVAIVALIVVLRDE